ncbi:hypothetical protein COCOBI_13-3110 [Coccomyxa sp. Obi]|nr:hypothetical protein COCOBI_13-3110 [Coccomyxa sp. Obi]
MKLFKEFSSIEESDNPTEERGSSENNKEDATDKVETDQHTNDTRKEGSPRGHFEAHAGSVNTSPIKSQGSENVMDTRKDLSCADAKTDEEPSEKEDYFNIPKYKAHYERNKKVLDKISTLVKLSNDSGHGDADGGKKASTEWVVGEWDGYPYKVPMKYHRRLENMTYRRLVQHKKAMKQRIEKGMEKEAKVIDVLEKLAASVV